MLEQVKMSWPLVAQVVSVPHTQADYERAIATLDELIDEVGEDEDHPLASLMETLGSLIEAYENEHLPEPMGNPLSSLQILLTEQNIGINDLPEIGDAATVSAILEGRREPTATECRILSERLHVAPAVFLQ